METPRPSIIPGQYEVANTRQAWEIFPADLTLPRLGMLTEGMVFEVSGPAVELKNSRLGISRQAIPVKIGETEGFVLVYSEDNLQEFFTRKTTP